MTLAPGTKLGPYEILSPLGAGGMGEVYKARDTRLERDVAIKVLPEEFFEDKVRRARFEKEAKTLAAFNHPGIAAIHSFEEIPGLPGSSGRHLLVMELVEGETLGERILRDPPGLEEAVLLARQIAEALEAAHEKGIVHRDLKPANVKVTREGKIKLLDFGLAKAFEEGASKGDSGSGLSQSPTLTARATTAGVILGTAAYMSPEQARGRSLDKRTDIWAFGCVLFEMLTGRRAFEGESVSDTLAAVLTKEPDWSRLPRETPAGMRALLRKCLARDARQRLHDIADVRLDIEEVTKSPAASSSSPPFEATPGRSLSGRSPFRSRFFLSLPWALAAACAAAAGFLLVSRGPPAQPAFRPLTFRRGLVTSARFTVDGHTVVYGAMWEGQPIRIFSTRIGSPESTQLSLPPGDILAVSPSGELALSLGRRFSTFFMSSGRLARVPMAGGAPREILEDVQEASWAPEGDRLLVTRQADGKWRLELAGSLVYESRAWISHARMSPRGDAIAFLEHPFPGADNGTLCLIPSSGKGGKKVLTGEWTSLQGLAWSPTGDEIWFTAARLGWIAALYAVTPEGRQRLVLRSPVRLLLHDLDARGRALLTSEHIRVGTYFGSFDSPEEKEVSWLESSFGDSISSDGKHVLLTEQGEGAGERYGLYLRGVDGSAAVRLGDGFNAVLSPDDRWVLAASQDDPPTLTLLPTGPGEARPLPTTGLTCQSLGWFPDGRRIIFGAVEKDKAARLYSQDLGGGAPRVLTGEGMGGSLGMVPVSPDGCWAAARGPGNRVFLCPTAGGEPVPLEGLAPGDTPVRFSSDGRILFCGRSGMDEAAIVALDLVTHTPTVRKRVRPADPAGIMTILPMDVTPDGRHYIYTYMRILSDLFLVEGLK